MCKCLFDKSLSVVALLFITETLKVSLWLLFTIHDLLLGIQEEGAAHTLHYLPYCAPFPRLNQSLQGDWLLSWLEFELQVEDWRVQVEAVLLGLLKKDMPLEVDFFWGSSDCCWVMSCWLMMIWMSSWGKAGRKWAGSLRSTVWCLMSTLPSYLYNSIFLSDCSRRSKLHAYLLTLTCGNHCILMV